MALTTISAVKLHIGIDLSDSSEDAFLAQLLIAVDAAFKHLTDRDIEQTTYTQYLCGRNNRVLLLPEYPVTTVTGVWQDQDGYWGQGVLPFPDETELVAGSDYALVKDGRGGDGETGRLLRIGGVWPGVWVTTVGMLTPVIKPGSGNIKVVYQAGFNPVPYDIQLTLWQTCAQLRDERETGKSITSEGYEEYHLAVTQQSMEELLMRPGSIAQVVARYKRITRRNTPLG